MEEKLLKNGNPFIWETHGIHVGTGKDHVKHGVDDLEEIIEHAIRMNHPGITFIIHTPRLTRLRYQSEKNTDIKFIRGDRAYFDYPERMAKLREKFKGRIKIRYGIELEWQGAGLGLQWNKSKIFQGWGADFVVGSVHFSNEGIPYDGSKEEAEKLVELRGGIENYWAGYIEEMIEMITSCWDMIQIVGHIDVPKLHIPYPESLRDLDTSSLFLARRMRTLLETISSYNLALDVNLAGLRKKCGIYPELELLQKANQLGIPVAIGTDAHHVEDLGRDYETALEYLQQAGYTNYVSFSRGIPEKRSLKNSEGAVKSFQVLNVAIELLNRRFEGRKRIDIPKFSFGGSFRSMLENFRDAVYLGDYHAIRVRKSDKSITVSDHPPSQNEGNERTKVKCLFSLHKDLPGTLSILLNTLSSEEINVETAYLYSLGNGTAIAYLTLSGEDHMILEAVDFIKGTTTDRFMMLDLLEEMSLPTLRKGPVYLLEVDGVELPIPISSHMILTVHNNQPGVLLILLSALASRNINVNDLQLGKRGDKGYAILGVDGDIQTVQNLLTTLGSQYHEITHLTLSSIEDFQF